MGVEFYHTIGNQIELLPRITIKYCGDKLFAIEWLWFGIYFSFYE
jgi:hypothetical protein